MSAQKNHLDQSLSAAQAIAEVVPDSMFCWFYTAIKDGEVKKYPLNKQNSSVGKETDLSVLVKGSELPTASRDIAEYWGLYMQRPTHHPDGILWVLDVDYKRTSKEISPIILKMIETAKKFGMLREKSHSGKGAHIFFVAPNDANIPAKIKIDEGQEIEVFGHMDERGHMRCAKSLMLTGIKLDGEVYSYPNAKELLLNLGVPEDLLTLAKKAPPTPPTYTIRDEYREVEEVLSWVHNYDDYDEWLRVGMAIKHKLGAAGFSVWDRWSAQSPKYDPEIMRDKWDSFKGDGVTFGTVVMMARQGGMRVNLPIQQTYTEVTPIQEAGNPNRFTFITAGQMVSQPRVGWRILDVIPRVGLVVMWGAPGSGKSFAAFDMGAHIARGIKYQGKRVKQGLVLIIAAEGDLVARTMAYMQHHNLSNDDLSNLRILKYAVDMRDPYADMPDLLAAITASIEDAGIPLAMVIVDTLNRVMHGGNENDSSDMGSVISNAKRIEDAFQCAVMFVHHSGKDETKGSRGHSSLKGAMDAEISILRSDDIRTMKIEKQKEGNDYYDLFNFKLVNVDLGAANIYDPDAELDERLSSCIIEKTDEVPEKKETKTKNYGLLDQAIKLSGTGDKEDVRKQYYLLHKSDNESTKRGAFWNDWNRYMRELNNGDGNDQF